MSRLMNQTGTAVKPTLAGHLSIMRFDHWIKNVFVLPGIVVALSETSGGFSALSWPRIIEGMLAVGIIASSNYTINELLDAPFDRKHPVKKSRPVPAGLVSVPLAYVQWIGLMILGMAISWHISQQFAATMAFLWIMGCVYNIPPVRSKDVPYLDVLSESVNNPLRMLAGWYMTVSDLTPPASLLMSYWMVGCYFMAIKRYAEYRDIGNPEVSAAYRKSFAYYDDKKLLVSIMFYAANSMLFFGAFIMRYRLELILSFPLVALVMAQYLALAFKPESGAERPEKLYREPSLMLSVCTCALVMALLLFIDLPSVRAIFTPSVTPQPLP